MSDVSSTVPASASKNGVTRRQLVKAGAWAAPAVAVAIAAPATAVSISEDPSLSAVNKLNNGGQPTAVWNVTLTVTGSTSPKSWAVTIVNTGGAGALTWTTPLPTAITAAGTYSGVVEVTGKNRDTVAFLVRLTSGAGSTLQTRDTNGQVVQKN